MLRPAVAALTSLVIVIALVIGGGLAAQPAAALQPDVTTAGLVLIDELANGDAESDSNSFVELRNWGDEAVDLTGWRLFRCSAQGLRSNVGRPESDLTGVILPPRGVITISRIGMPGRLHVTQPFALGGFGMYLESPDGVLADRIGVYPNEPWPTESECTPEGGNLPNVLDFSRDQSWQRIAATGDVTTDWIVAPSTIGHPNTIASSPRAAGAVVISEITGAGPAGGGDDFVELRNDGPDRVDLSGWTLDRCTASGRLRPSGRELQIADGTALDPGDTWVAGGPGFTGEADARYDVSLGDVEFGVAVHDRDGRLADRVAVSAYADSACQSDDSKLAAILDAVAGESWQRAPSGWVIAPRTPGTANRTGDQSVMFSSFDYPAQPRVAISEIATDPADSESPAGSTQQNWIELGNYGGEPVDISRWTVRRCQADGTRALDLQVTVADGTVLAPGAVFLVARSGTAAAAAADATYDVSLNFLGAGIWIADEHGRRVDSAGIFAANEMDSSNVIDSPCTKGVALTTYLPDRMLAETFQRSRFTGVDADDFVAGPATPGVIDTVEWIDPTLRVTGVVAPGQERERVITTAGLGTRAESLDQPVAVLEAWGGSSEAPLVSERGDVETAIQPGSPVLDDGYRYPYQRLVIDATSLAAGSTVGWSGITEPRHEIQLSVWNGGAWRPLGATAADPETGVVEVRGTLEAGDLREAKATLLVQDGPRTQPTMASGIDGLLQDPASYDFAISHITDTQYLTESYPEVYAQLVSWIADNAGDRKIAFATHTGDLIQNWVDPDQSLDRAEREFARASAIQGILDEAGVPNSVLPGNHDNKRGVDNTLYNAYFPPSRYEGTDWYGGSIAPTDNSANFSTFEAAGARFLMISLPYAYGDREMDWATEVIEAHPTYNVIVSTHEHVTPMTTEVAAGRSANSRWVSRGAELWERVIAPNRNVVLVLSGHFHGLGQLTTQNAGGLEGHTVVELLADYQEFRTHTGERATGFQRLLQLDLASGGVAVDTFSVRLDATKSFPYDYRQFVPDNGLSTTPSNARPWRIVEAGLQGRYGESDDEFAVQVAFQYRKTVITTGVATS
ncbi:MAG: lamin tail domain-containing protein [Pseudolysinimonas sp.]